MLHLPGHHGQHADHFLRQQPFAQPLKSVASSVPYRRTVHVCTVVNSCRCLKPLDCHVPLSASLRKNNHPNRGFSSGAQTVIHLSAAIFGLAPGSLRPHRDCADTLKNHPARHPPRGPRHALSLHFTTCHRRSAATNAPGASPTASPTASLKVRSIAPRSIEKVCTIRVGKSCSA